MKKFFICWTCFWLGVFAIPIPTAIFYGLLCNIPIFSAPHGVMTGYDWSYDHFVYGWFTSALIWAVVLPVLWKLLTYQTPIDPEKEAKWSSALRPDEPRPPRRQRLRPDYIPDPSMPPPSLPPSVDRIVLTGVFGRHVETNVGEEEQLLAFYNKTALPLLIKAYGRAPSWESFRDTMAAGGVYPDSFMQDDDDDDDWRGEAEPDYEGDVIDGVAERVGSRR